MIKAPIKAIQDFLRLEAASGVILLLMLAIVLIIANTPLNGAYQHLIKWDLSIRLFGFGMTEPLYEWVNEGLMALFFMLLSLEMKRELVAGELSHPSRVVLPLVTAAGGIILPIAIFLLLVPGHDATAMRGWAIPSTTDIALVLALMALLRSRIPASLKIWMIALSIVDDVIAIALIAIYYATDLSYTALILAGIGIVILLILNRLNVSRISIYLLVGIFIWLAVLHSGVHATLAGTIVGLFIPYEDKKTGYSPIRVLEHRLHVWVAYLILPVFILVNGGIRFVGVPINETFSALPIAIAMGLFLGKQLGIFGFGFIAIKLKFAQLPKHANWQQFYGVSVLAGIGFTMSIFISSLAYADTKFEMISKHGILLGSLLSALLGVIVLLFVKPKKSTC